MTNAAIQSSFERAVARHRAGQLADAAKLYREVLEHDAGHEQALFLSAAVAIELGRHEDAEPVLQKLLERSPHNPIYWTNLGEARRRAGRDEQAAQAFVRAIGLKPDLAQAHFNLGLVTRKLGEVETAIRAFERAAELKPEEPQLQHGLASALVAHGEHARAVGHFQCALLASPSSSRILLDYSSCLRQLRRFDAALAAAERALALEPKSALAEHERSASLTELGRFDAALQASERALALEPSSSAALTGHAAALTDTGRLSEALECYRRAVALDPADHLAHSNLVYLMAFEHGVTAHAILDEARAWSKRHAEPFVKLQRAHDNAREPARRLRVGYVSSNLHGHALTLFLLPLLAAHDRDGFELFAYSSSTRTDATSGRVRGLVDQWHEIGRLEPPAAAELIRSHRIDVLVDLTMHMSLSLLRIFACKPAPVQIAWLAYPGTTGLEAMDYRVTDRYLDPPDAALQPYAEAPLWLPDTFWCYDPGEGVPEVSPLPALSRGHVTFGCLNSFWKLNDSTLRRFAGVLKRVPGSRLMLLAPEGQARSLLLETFATEGIEPSRLQLEARRPRDQYLELYHHIDIGLDTLPYGGHTTSLDAFYMGVPVVSLTGDTVVGRAGVCHAANLELPQLSCDSEARLLAATTTLAEDLPGLAALRSSLRGRLRRSPLMDAPRFARNLEAQYRRAWRDWCGTESV
jgi:protein O-GlcNAc transferase